MTSPTFRVDRLVSPRRHGIDISRTSERQIDLVIIHASTSGQPLITLPRPFVLSSLQWSALYPFSECPSTHPSGFEGHGNAGAASVRQRSSRVVPRTRRDPVRLRLGVGRLYIAPSRHAFLQYSRARPSREGISVLSRWCFLDSRCGFPAEQESFSQGNGANITRRTITDPFNDCALQVPHQKR